MSSGEWFAAGPCWACGTFLLFNPETVPSYAGEPLCRSCVELINTRRAELGKAPISIPAGCYVD